MDRSAENRVVCRVSHLRSKYGGEAYPVGDTIHRGVWQKGRSRKTQDRGTADYLPRKRGWQTYRRSALEKSITVPLRSCCFRLDPALLIVSAPSPLSSQRLTMYLSATYLVTSSINCYVSSVLGAGHMDQTHPWKVSEYEIKSLNLPIIIHS